jgi:hypothetical protein
LANIPDINKKENSRSHKQYVQSVDFFFILFLFIYLFILIFFFEMVHTDICHTCIQKMKEETSFSSNRGLPE